MTMTREESLARARRLAAQGEWAAVRSLLAPVVAERRRGLALYLLARAEFELGDAAAAAPLVEEFREQRPAHGAAHLLAAQVGLATGDLDAAEEAARVGAMVSSAEEPYAAVLGEVAARRREQYDVRADLAVIDAGHLAARRDGPTQELLDAAARVARIEPGGSWPDDPTEARIAYFHHAADVVAALRNYDPDLIDASVRFGYLTWPRRIQAHVRGKDVADIGCGFGGFGMGFLVAGATSYLGVDPDMDLDSARARDKRARAWDDMGVTPREIAENLPAIQLSRTAAEEFSTDRTFDTISLHNVTEHLARLDDVLAGLVRLCHPGTDLVFLHHNFHCWNGHHQAPVQPAQLDEDDPRHREVYDWRHIDLAPHVPEDHYLRARLNHVRLDDLRRSVERHFDIVRWDEVPSSQETLARLTPEIVERVRATIPDITTRELSVNTVLCVARPRRPVRP